MKELEKEDDSDKKTKILSVIQKLKLKRKKLDEEMAEKIYNKFSKEVKQTVAIPYDAPLIARQKFIDLYQKEKDIDPQVLQKVMQEQQEIIQEQKLLEARLEISLHQN